MKLSNKRLALSMLVGAVMALVLFGMDAHGKAYWWSAFDRCNRFGMTVKFNDQDLQQQRHEVLYSADTLYDQARQLYVVRRFYDHGLQAACIGSLIGLLITVSSTYLLGTRNQRRKINYEASHQPH